MLAGGCDALPPYFCDLYNHYMKQIDFLILLNLAFVAINLFAFLSGSGSIMNLIALLINGGCAAWMYAERRRLT
jgi:hypothetical protein